MYEEMGDYVTADRIRADVGKRNRDPFQEQYEREITEQYHTECLNQYVADCWLQALDAGKDAELAVPGGE